VHLDSDGNLLIDARNTWTTYKVGHHSGRIIWQLGGKVSSFALSAAPGQSLNAAGDIFAWQHDPNAVGHGECTFFDNESAGLANTGSGATSEFAFSRAVRVRLDERRRTATLVQSYDQPERGRPLEPPARAGRSRTHGSPGHRWIESRRVTEIQDVAPGLWVWSRPHPDWTPDSDFEGPVTSTCVAVGGEIVVLDPLAPEPDAAEAWARLDAAPPTVAVILKPDHVRDVDLFIRRYGARGFGPWLFYRGEAPRSALTAIEPGSEIPGGLVALYDGRGRAETPVWIAEHRTLVFADALGAPRGELLVWDCPALQERALPALRALLELPFERVIVSHGEPVHDRAAYERALTLPPWRG
jgi:glyoxylase-like metal-dependent hydrolase (beta-lactamase superfamily II)